MGNEKLSSLRDRTIDLAMMLLDSETTPTAATVEVAGKLAEIAFSAETLILHSEKIRSASAAFRARV